MTTKIDLSLTERERIIVEIALATLVRDDAGQELFLRAIKKRLEPVADKVT